MNLRASYSSITDSVLYVVTIQRYVMSAAPEASRSCHCQILRAYVSWYGHGPRSLGKRLSNRQEVCKFINSLIWQEPVGEQINISQKTWVVYLRMICLR